MSNVRTQLPEKAETSKSAEMKQRVLTPSAARFGKAQRLCRQWPGREVSASLGKIRWPRRAVRPLAASAPPVGHLCSESLQGCASSGVRAFAGAALQLRLQSSNPSFERTVNRLRRSPAAQVKR